MNVKYIVKLWEFLRYFVLAKKHWRSPRRSDLLIFDATGQEFLYDYCEQWAPETLHVRGEQINMRAMFLSFFRVGKRSDTYYDCFIEIVKPRLIVTLVDNHLAFYSIAKRHPNVKTMFIQNGIRGSEIFDQMERLYQAKDQYRVDYMMTFNQNIGARFAKHIEGSVIPIGSFRNNRFEKRTEKQLDVIAFISQYRGNSGLFLGDRYYSRQEFFDQCDKVVLEFLAGYSRKYGKKLLIIPSSGISHGLSFDDERQYFNQLLGVPLEFSQPRRSGTSYDATDSAEVVVSIDSTLAYESIRRGNKTAFFSIRKQLLDLPDRAFGWPSVMPEEGVFWSTRCDPVIFEKIMDHLFSISDQQWRADLSGHSFENILEYDPGNTKLRAVLQRELGSEPSRLRSAA